IDRQTGGKHTCPLASVISVTDKKSHPPFNHTRVRHWLALSQMLFTSRRMNEGDLHMGGIDNVDRHVDTQARNIVKDDAIAKDNCPSAAAAAHDFNRVLHMEHRGLDAQH